MRLVKPVELLRRMEQCAWHARRALMPSLSHLPVQIAGCQNIPLQKHHAARLYANLVVTFRAGKPALSVRPGAIRAVEICTVAVALASLDS